MAQKATKQAESEQFNHGVRRRAYPLNPPPKRGESFAISLAEEVLPNLDFKKAADVAHVWRMAVGHSKQNDSLAPQNGVPGRDGEHWYSRYEECEERSLMVILVVGHEEVVALPSKSGRCHSCIFGDIIPGLSKTMRRGELGLMW